MGMTWKYIGDTLKYIEITWNSCILCGCNSIFLDTWWMDGGYMVDTCGYTVDTCGYMWIHGGYMGITWEYIGDTLKYVETTGYMVDTGRYMHMLVTDTCPLLVDMVDTGGYMVKLVDTWQILADMRGYMVDTWWIHVIHGKNWWIHGRYW